MTTKDKLRKEIEDAPDDLLVEALDYIRYLKKRLILERRETLVVSESSLKKDWLRPEEDSAWKDL